MKNLGSLVRLLSRIPVCLALSMVVFSARSHQQSPLQAGNSHDSLPVRVSTRLVQVNVIVNDKHGNPITGLARKDFSIFDSGKPQEIRVFSAESNLPATASWEPLSSGTYTNRPEEQTSIPSSVTVILLDALNTEAADQTLARKQVLRVLREIQPQEFVALYWLGDSLHILHDFTTDASSLQQVLADYEGKASRDLDNSELADPSLNNPNPSTPAGQSYDRQAFRLAFDQRVANQSTRNRVQVTVAALVAIANHLGTRKGRKNLVWVSSSFPVSLGYDKFDLNWTNDTGENFAGDVRRAAQALTDADIAVYPVDARGLLGSSIRANQDDLEAHIGDPTDMDTHLPDRAAPGSADTMRLLAERTGGKAFYGTNDIAGAIRHAMNDSRATYTLGYYPAGIQWDGRFHDIKVKVSVPGVEVRARSGYFALPDLPQAPPRTDRAFFSQIASGGLPATGIGLHVRVQPAKEPASRSLAVDARLDLRELTIQQKDGRLSGNVRSVFLQLDSDGRILKADDRTFFPDFDASTYERALQIGISDTRQFQVLPGATQLCVIVLDPASSKIGSIFVQLSQYFPNLPKAARNKN